jgi:hypothetical protein
MKGIPLLLVRRLDIEWVSYFCGIHAINLAAIPAGADPSAAIKKWIAVDFGLPERL